MDYYSVPTKEYNKDAVAVRFKRIGEYVEWCQIAANSRFVESEQDYAAPDNFHKYVRPYKPSAFIGVHWYRSERVIAIRPNQTNFITNEMYADITVHKKDS